MNIFAVITKDSHIEFNVELFSEEKAAISYARFVASDNASDPDSIEEQELNEDMVNDGWIFFCAYGVEDDNVRVIRRVLDSEL